jgi:hypothetical protein
MKRVGACGAADAFAGDGLVDLAEAAGAHCNCEWERVGRGKRGESPVVF